MLGRLARSSRRHETGVRSNAMKRDPVGPSGLRRGMENQRLRSVVGAARPIPQDAGLVLGAQHRSRAHRALSQTNLIGHEPPFEKIEIGMAPRHRFTPSADRRLGDGGSEMRSDPDPKTMPKGASLQACEGENLP